MKKQRQLRIDSVHKIIGILLEILSAVKILKDLFF